MDGLNRYLMFRLKLKQLDKAVFQIGTIRVWSAGMSSRFVSAETRSICAVIQVLSLLETATLLDSHSMTPIFRVQTR